MIMEQILLGTGGYLLGAIPSGYLIARYFYGIDIRKHGSGNPGTANVYRVCGKNAGFATLIFDSFKGFLPTAAAMHRGYPIEFAALVGGLAVVGHIWTLFLGFKGGKGVATGAGVFAALLPVPTLCATAAFILGVALSTHISIGSMAGAAVLPIAAFALGSPLILSLGATALAALILVRHISNLQRILKGKEFKFGHKPPQP